MTTDVHPADWAVAADHAATPGAVVLAGGTGVQPWLSTTQATPPLLVHLRDVRGAGALTGTSTHLQIGAMVPVGQPQLAPWFGEEGAGWFATPAVRRRATLVGNIVSRLGPAELGPLLAAVDGQVLTFSGRVLAVPAVIRDGLPAGELATALRVRRAERISYHRLTPRPRVSRVELGLCAALGDGCGAALVATTAGVPHLVDGGAAGRVGDFIDAVRDRFTAVSGDAGDLDIVTALARRVHRDLHTGSRQR